MDKGNKKGLKVFSGIVAGVIGVVMILQIIPPMKTTDELTNPFLKRKGERPLIVAHAGAEELYPTNTFLAFKKSYEMGVDMFETDTHMTKDGVLLTHHDDTIDRVSNGTGYVKDYTYNELLEYNFAYSFKNKKGKYTYGEKPQKVCTIEELFKEFPDMLYSIDLKAKGEEGIKAGVELAKLIRKYKMEDRVIVASFNNEVLEAFKKETNNEIMTSCGYKETTKFITHLLTFTGLFYTGTDEALQIPTKEMGINLAAKQVTKSAHRRGMAVQYWTINDKEQMKKLIKIGADGIITDRPDLMLEVLEEMGYPSEKVIR